jgi:cytochrome bd-type quinol oxidase subunit 1
MHRQAWAVQTYMHAVDSCKVSPRTLQDVHAHVYVYVCVANVCMAYGYPSLRTMPRSRRQQAQQQERTSALAAS